MPFLPISDGDGTLTDQESENIAPFMAHPGDEKARETFVSYMRARSVLVSLPHLPATTKFTFTAADLRILLELTLNPKLDVLKSYQGMLIGEMLVCNLICARDHPGLMGIKRTIYAFSNRRLSERSLMERWVKFRPVAHLWASARYWDGRGVFFSTSKDVNVDWVKNPVARLQFLAVAEILRSMGENTYAHGQRRRGKPLLDPEETWKVPPDLALPSVSLALPTALPDLLLQRLRSYRPPR